MFNRRNALLGWVAWQVIRRVMKQKARAAVPSIDTETKRPNKGAIVAALALIVGGLFFWRSWTGGEEGAL